MFVCSGGRGRPPLRFLLVPYKSYWAALIRCSPDLLFLFGIGVLIFCPLYGRSPDRAMSVSIYNHRPCQPYPKVPVSYGHLDRCDAILRLILRMIRRSLHLSEYHSSILIILGHSLKLSFLLPDPVARIIRVIRSCIRDVGDAVPYKVGDTHSVWL